MFASWRRRKPRPPEFAMMPNTPIKEHEVVALLEANAAEALAEGQVGTVVSVLSPAAYLVEFMDAEGYTIALCQVAREALLPLKHERAMAV